MSLQYHIRIPLVLATIFTGLLVARSHANEELDFVYAEVRWKEDEKVQYEIVKTRRKSQGGKVTSHSKSHTPVVIEILKATDDGYLLSWTVGKTTLEDRKQAENPLVKQMSNLLKRFTILLHVDSEGTFNDVQNWKELKEMSATLIVTMTDELKRAGLPEDRINKLRNQVRSMFSTKQQIEQLCTREAQMFLLPLGRVYSLSREIEYDDQLPNPLGGQPFPCRGVFSLKGYDKESSIATVSWKQTVDPAESRRIMEKTLKDLAARLGRPVPGGDILKTLTIEDQAEFSLDVASGWPKRLTHTRTVKSGDRLQEDSLTIQRKQ